VFSSSHFRARHQNAPTKVGLLGAALLALVAPLATGTAISALTPTSASAATNQWAPTHKGDFPDPNVMFFGSTYYAFSTQSFGPLAQTINIQTSTSSDGINWTTSYTDALPHLGSWAKKGNTWAPAVAFNGTGFVMYYVATQASDGFQCIGRATSNNPTGPYVDPNAAPVVCQDGLDGEGGNYGGSIDPNIFEDNGSATLIWKSDGNHIGIGTAIWSQPLSTNLLSLTGAPAQILTTDQAWQGSVIEGPDMVDHQGTDYLFYSGGDYSSATYAIGYAVCPNGPLSPCLDGATNPILNSQPGMSGPGGPDAFVMPSGQLDLAFSAWQGTTIGYMACGIRPMYQATVDFGSTGAPTLTPALVGPAAPSPTCASPPPPHLPGYWQVAADGGIFTFGSAQFYGSTGAIRLNKPVVAMAATPDGKGYWLVASDGGIFSFGDAHFWGSTGAIRLNRPIVGMVPTVDGKGYWLVASDGGVFAFGNAPFYGSLAGYYYGDPITAMAPAFLNGGYWLVNANGQVFTFGNATFWGEPPYAPGGYRITGMAGTQSANGYWLASANGNVATEGSAPSYGSLIGDTLNAPIVGMATTRDVAGYWLQGADGGIFCFGDAPYFGSMGGQHLNAPMVGIAAS
jgi:hypothetical protein